MDSPSAFLTTPWSNEINYKWEITYFPKEYTTLSSPFFPENSTSNCQWYFSLSISFSNFCSLSLYSRDCMTSPIPTIISLTIRTWGTIKNLPRANVIFRHKPDNIYCWRDCIHKNDVPGSLIITCNIKILKESRQEYLDRSVRASKDDCLNSFGALLDDPNHGDIVLVSSEGKELRAHKVFLAARSPVFKAMFSHEMEENVNNKVVVPDVDYQTLKSLLAYIYTGSLSSLTESEKIKLIVSADKYDLPALKYLLEELLISDLRKDNAIRLLLLSDKYSLKHLFQHLLTYFGSEKREYFTETEEWKNETSDRLPFLTAYFNQMKVLQEKYDQIDYTEPEQ